MSHSAASNITSNKSASLVAAAKAAAQINAQLAAEGKIHLLDQNTLQLSNPVKKEKKTKCGRKDLFHAEVEINDLPQRVRNLLTKGYIQEQIQWRSKAALCTKGRYIPPQERNAQKCEKPLYICVQAVDSNAVDNAVHEIKKFIQEHTGSALASFSETPTAKHVLENLPVQLPPPKVMIRDKVYINLDHAPPTFKLLERVIGSSGDNITYIQSETGVTVTIQGQGCTPGIVDEPLHLLLEHSDAAAVQSARVLALSLVGTLQQDYVLWQREQNAIQQQQQHFVYTLTQPCYQGSSTGNVSCQYPALAMIYGVGNGLGETSASSEQQSVRTLVQQDLLTERPSRFDFQQIAGSQTATVGNLLPSNKRPKLGNPSNN